MSGNDSACINIKLSHTMTECDHDAIMIVVNLMIGSSGEVEKVTWFKGDIQNRLTKFFLSHISCTHTHTHTHTHHLCMYICMTVYSCMSLNVLTTRISWQHFGVFPVF